MQNNALPSVTLADIRAVYSHMPETPAVESPLRHPALLVFVHDQEDVANAPGQSFLAQNNDPTGKMRQPLAVAAEMAQADYKIFDLTPPEKIALPCSEHDLGLALSYGMVTVEQGVDFVALFALGQSSVTSLQNIHSLEDVGRFGALNVAAAYGALIAASMAQIPVVAAQDLADCLDRIAANENIVSFAHPLPGSLTEAALDIVRRKALANITS